MLKSSIKKVEQDLRSCKEFVEKELKIGSSGCNWVKIPKNRPYTVAITVKNLTVNCGNLSHWSIDENREERLVILGWPLPCHPLKRQLVFDCHERNPTTL